MSTGKNGCGRLYDVNGKRVYVYKYPDLSMTPEALGLFIVLVIGLLILDFFHLSYGGIASEAQLKYGVTAKAEEKTGPNKDYYIEAIEIIKKEAIKRESSLKNTDLIFVEWHPEETTFLYGMQNGQRAGYIGNGRFRVCIHYMINNGNKTKLIYAMGIVRLEQEAVAFWVRQTWTVDSFRITYQR